MSGMPAREVRYGTAVEVAPMMVLVMVVAAWRADGRLTANFGN